MLTALALSLIINSVATKAVQNKARLPVGTVFIFMCLNYKARTVPKKKLV